jgi:hypothetical protein
MNVNQRNVMRVLRAALFGFALFLIGYMIPHPGALAQPSATPTGGSVPGGFNGKGLVTITQGTWPCASAPSCTVVLNVEASSSGLPNADCPALAQCAQFNANAANFPVTWLDSYDNPLSSGKVYLAGSIAVQAPSPSPSPSP